MILDLTPIKSRLAAATPGPWEKVDRSGWMENAHGPQWEIDDSDGKEMYWTALVRMECNAELIAHAPSDLAALVAEVERLRARLAQYEEVEP